MILYRVTYNYSWASREQFRRVGRIFLKRLPEDLNSWAKRKFDPIHFNPSAVSVDKVRYGALVYETVGRDH